MVIILTYVHYIIGVYGDTRGKFSSPSPPPILPKSHQEVSVFCKDVDTMVLPVSDVHIPCAIKRNIPGVLELTIGTAFTAFAAETAVECQVSI